MKAIMRRHRSISKFKNMVGSILQYLAARFHDIRPLSTSSYLLVWNAAMPFDVPFDVPFDGQHDLLKKPTNY